MAEFVNNEYVSRWGTHDVNKTCKKKKVEKKVDSCKED